MTNGPVVRNNQLWFYYLACRHRSQSIEDTLNRRYLDGAATCMARLRMDGFVSLKGGVEWGSVLTNRSRLRETGYTSMWIRGGKGNGRGPGHFQQRADRRICERRFRAGSIGQHRSFPELEGENGPSELRGRTVRLRFSLWSGELYSYWFE